jgi:hypothetical protein
MGRRSPDGSAVEAEATWVAPSIVEAVDWLLSGAAGALV